MLAQLLALLNSPAGQAAMTAGAGLFERGLAAIEALIESEKGNATPGSPKA